MVTDCHFIKCAGLFAVKIMQISGFRGKQIWGKLPQLKNITLHANWCHLTVGGIW